MDRARMDPLGLSIWLAVGLMLVLIVGIEVARRRVEFRYASAPLWPRPDGSVALQPPRRRASGTGIVGRSYGEVWDLEEHATAAA